MQVQQSVKPNRNKNNNVNNNNNSSVSNKINNKQYQSQQNLQKFDKSPRSGPLATLKPTKLSPQQQLNKTTITIRDTIYVTRQLCSKLRKLNSLKRRV